MPEREKVMRGLECCNNDVPICEDCPYINIDHCIDALMADTLHVLRTPEPCYPTIRWSNDGKAWCYVCSHCGAILLDGEDVCPGCEREVKWPS